MYRGISLQGFRGFEKFDLSGLGRINLLVGANNSGKTSILEAVGLLASRGDPRHLFATLLRRGEFAWSEARSGRITRTPRVRHIFKGHIVAAGSVTAISGVHMDRQALAVLVREGPLAPDDVTIQRIERTRSTATRFSEQEILAAADRGIEIR